MAGSILNAISIEFGASSAEVNWVLSGWAIASTVSVTAIGKLSDIYGRRWMMLVGNFFTLVGSVCYSPWSTASSWGPAPVVITELTYMFEKIVAATAQSVSAVIAGSTLIGFGFGFLLLVFTCVPELCAFKYR